MIAPSELILNKDGSIYHLKLRPEQLASKVIIAGDPGRINLISSHFDTIEHKVANREFVTHTGTYKGQRVSAIATGIGADNIDIVMNELDALVNIDLKNRVQNSKLKGLEIVRIGTCGSLQSNIPSGQIIVSTHAIGFDGLLNFYSFEMNNKEGELLKEFYKQVKWEKGLNPLYLVEGSFDLISKVGTGFHKGITVTANGFYGPQGRAIRIQPKYPDLNLHLQRFKYLNHRVVNYEMECSAVYGLSKLLGHQACTVCAVIANRYSKSVNADYQLIMNNLIETVLDRLTG